jgi:hypothetical protein
LSSLESSARHSIPLDRALQAVAANGEIPMNMNNLLDSHHYVTVPVLTTVIFMILIAATIGGVVITRMKAVNRATRQTLNYLNQASGIMQETVRNQELNREEDKIRPRKHHAPMPPPTAPQTTTYRPPNVPLPYAIPGAGQPGYSLGASPSLEADMLGTAATTAGHSLGMHHKQAAAMLGFQTGRDQAPVMIFPRATPTSIAMKTMMAGQ